MNKLPRLALIFLFTLIFSENTFSQRTRSPQINPDNSVTFRLRAGQAKTISVGIAGQTVNLLKKSNNLWEGRSRPLPPGIHDYTFKLDGTTVTDPQNRNVKKWLSLASMVEIRGNPPLLTEKLNVPHGKVTKEFYPDYKNKTQRPLVVYTPPGYDPKKEYPILILLHGYGDDETAWTEVGRAHLIADNLIHRRQIRDIIIAMPYGHPNPIIDGPRPRDYMEKNAQAYTKDIHINLIPYLKSEYSISTKISDWSLAGLSMGGGQTIDAGLKHPDKFQSFGIFSAAAPTENLENQFPDLVGPKAKINEMNRFIWIAIGSRDFLLNRNKSFTQFLDQNSVKHVYKETGGGHEWKLWRQYLSEFLILTNVADR